MHHRREQPHAVPPADLVHRHDGLDGAYSPSFAEYTRVEADRAGHDAYPGWVVDQQRWDLGDGAADHVNGVAASGDSSGRPAILAEWLRRGRSSSAQPERRNAFVRFYAPVPRPL